MGPSWQQAAEPSCVRSPSLKEDYLQKPKLGLPVVWSGGTTELNVLGTIEQRDGREGKLRS